MAYRVPLDAGALLAAVLLVAPVAGAQVCDVVDVSSKDYRRFLDAVYSPNGLLTLQTFHDMEMPVVTEVSRENTAIIDERKGVYHPVEFGDRKAVDMRAHTPFFQEMLIDGPFFIIGVLDDTLRVTRNSAEGYAYDKGLNERFEGRLEYGSFGEAARALTEAEFWKQVFLGSIGKGERVVNVLRSRDFTVTTTCASSGCSQEMYSLFTKYLNIGASAQMILELGGGAVWRRVVPPPVKAEVHGVATRITASVTRPVAGLKKEILDRVSGLDDSTKQLLRGSDDLPGLTDPSFSYKRLDELPLKEKRVVLQYMVYVGALAEEAGRLSDRVITAYSNKGGEIGESSVARLAQLLEDLDDAFSRADIKTVVVTYSKEGEKVNKKISEISLKKVAESLRKEPGSAVGQLELVKNLLATTAENASLAAKHLSGQVPITYTLSNLLEDVLLSRVPGYDKHPGVINYIVEPAVYYIAKRLPMAHRSDPFAATGAYHVPSFSWPFLVGAGLKLPDTWKVGVIYPPRGATFTDSFVDIIINGGSDPGDAFKTLVTLSGAKVIVSAVEQAIGKDIPTGGIMLDEEAEKAYRAGPAVVAFGVAADECPACTLRGYGYTLTFTGSQHVPAFGSVVEDTNALSEGSTAIVFGHRVDMNFVDARLDIVKAEAEGKSCYDTCPLLKNPISGVFFGDNPAAAMFVMSWVQSLSATFGFGGVLLTTAGMYVAARGCYDCVDTLGGYYLHLRVPPKKQSEEVFELSAGDALTAVLDAAGSVLGSVSDVLEAEVNAFKKKVIAENIRNQGVYVQFHLDGISHGELRVAKLIELWMKPRSMVPTSMGEKGSIAGGSDDGRTVAFDRKSGVMSVDGRPVIDNAELLRMTYVDNTVPGIVVPAWAIVTEFTADPAFEATRDGYAVKDTAFLECFASHVPGGRPDTEFFHEVMGDIVAIRTELGSVDFAAENVVGTTRDWSGIVYAVSVGSDYNVNVKAATYSVEEKGDGVKVDVETREKPFGKLESIVFENGAVYYWNGKLYVHIRRIVTVPGSYVASVELSPEENGIGVKFTPTPDAPEDIREKIERLNDAIDGMGGINTIVAENGAVAVFRDENGNLWLRLFDRNALRSMTADDAYAVLLSVLSGDGEHDVFEVLDGSLRIFREDGQLYLSYVDRADGSRKVVRIKSYELGENGVVLETEDGEHILTVQERDGTVVAALDGNVYGPVAAPGSMVQKRIKNMYTDPSTGDLVIETEDGVHRIRLEVDRHGRPQLYIDDVLKGIVQLMQGPRGYVAYDPDTGEWSLVAGLITPLAEAFKGGIKISLNSNGQLAATPATWGFKMNPYAATGGQGLSLPLFHGPEVALLLLAVAAVFALIR